MCQLCHILLCLTPVQKAHLRTFTQERHCIWRVTKCHWCFLKLNQVLFMFNVFLCSCQSSACIRGPRMASFQWLVACDADRKACYGNENNTNVINKMYHCTSGESWRPNACCFQSCWVKHQLRPIYDFFLSVYHHYKTVGCLYTEVLGAKH